MFVSRNSEEVARIPRRPNQLIAMHRLRTITIRYRICLKYWSLTDLMMGGLAWRRCNHSLQYARKVNCKLTSFFISWTEHDFVSFLAVSWSQVELNDYHVLHITLITLSNFYEFLLSYRYYRIHGLFCGQQSMSSGVVLRCKKHGFCVHLWYED